MNNFILRILSSSRTMGLLFLILVVALMTGTFLDANSNISPSPFTEFWIYKAKWFEFLILLLVVNFVLHAIKFRLIQQKKWTLLALHSALIIIVIGASVTRYFGYEGMMHIRQGSQENNFYSYDNFLQVHSRINGSEKSSYHYVSSPLFLSHRLENNYSSNHMLEDTKVNVNLLKFVENAKIIRSVVPDSDANVLLHLVESSEGKRIEHFIEAGETVIVGSQLVSFQDSIRPASLKILKRGEEYIIVSHSDGERYDMQSGEKEILVSSHQSPLKHLQLYTFDGASFVIPKMPQRARVIEDLVLDKSSKLKGIELSVSSDSESKSVFLLNDSPGFKPEQKEVLIDDKNILLSFGAKEYEVPFILRLDDFIVEKYPGNEKAYKAFESKVEVIEKENSFNTSISMNNVLNYKGYRFFQTSFDTDERGTYLSVNHDFWGTLISYFGYFMLFVSMVLLLFVKSSRFNRAYKTLRESSLLIVFLLTAFSISVCGQNTFISDHAISHDLAQDFGGLVCQDVNGRMKPINTYATELLSKISRKASYEELDANQFLFSISQFPSKWTDAKIIFIKEGNDSIRNVLELSSTEKYASLNDFYTDDKRLKIPPTLIQQVSMGFNPNQFEKDIMRAFQKQYLFGQALEGNLLKIFPKPGDINNKWLSYNDFIASEIDYGSDSFLKNTELVFVEGTNSSEVLMSFFKELRDVQLKHGRNILPSKTKIKAEIFYNKINLFKKLYLGYLMLGLALLLFSILQIFWDNRGVRTTSSFLATCIFSLGVVHFTALLWRWYLSGHVPWSDAYESMIYIAFATIVIGIILGRKSKIAIAATSFVSSMILMVAQWNFIDPSIANLQPVLDSYWLMIHVAIIVGSYGPFTLSMILGILYLILYSLSEFASSGKLIQTLKQISIINQLSMTIGLVMLVIGNFLGAMWANESWGRYWGWDPKETWALISILIYAFIIHMHFIPKLKSVVAFNMASVLAYASILMTYFGVNFYMTGLHSYATGDKVVTPTSLYFAFVFIVILIVLVYRKYSLDEKLIKKKFY